MEANLKTLNLRLLVTVVVMITVSIAAVSAKPRRPHSTLATPTSDANHKESSAHLDTNSAHLDTNPAQLDTNPARVDTNSARVDTNSASVDTKSAPRALRSKNSTGDCPAACMCSKGGLSVNCEGKKLTEIPDGIPPQVQKLYLDHNNFNALKTGALANFQHLQEVYLRMCNIQTISPGAFQNLPGLENLYLVNNYITSVQPEAFQNVGGLTYLNLQANRLTSIPDLSSLTGLTQLILEANRIRNGTFPAGYQSLHGLSQVVLSNNNLTELTNATFASLSNSTVRKMEVSRCQIRTIESRALSPLTSLVSLKIGNNPLDGEQLQNLLLSLSEDLKLASLDIRQINLGGSLPNGSFSILAKTPLATLIFRSNQVGTVPARAFAHLPNLVILDLGYCKIQKVEDEAFADLPMLQRLFLNNNMLEGVPAGLPTSLTNLYLQFNSLTTLKNDDFSTLGKLQELYLSNNNINEVAEDSFLGLSNLVILHLQHNLISYIPKKLFSYSTKLRQLSLRYNKLKNLAPNQGALASLTALLTLDMSHNDLGYVPFDFFADLSSLKTLLLDFNRLGGPFAGDTGGRLLAGMTSLQKLSLESNSIEQIYDTQFKSLNSLQTLVLRNNRLSSWGPALFYTPGTLRKTLTTVDLSMNHIALVNETSVRDLQNVKVLNMSLNPFACTCDLRWFRTWLDNTTVNVANKTTYKCNSPPEWENKPLLTFGADKINCTDYTWYYVGGAIGGTLIIALVVCFIIYRHRWFIWLRLYRLRKAMSQCCCGGRQTQDGYTRLPGEDGGVGAALYDFYVISAEEDQEWVENKLLPRLDCGPKVRNRQERYGGRCRLYYEPRDAPDGHQHISNFDTAIVASDAVLVVLSRDLDNAYTSFLIDTTYQMKAEGRLQKFKIIQVGYVEPRHIPKTLHRPFDNNDFITWVETPEHLEAALGLDPAPAQGQGHGHDEGQERDQGQEDLERGIN